MREFINEFHGKIEFEFLLKDNESVYVERLRMKHIEWQNKLYLVDSWNRCGEIWHVVCFISDKNNKIKFICS
jgi:ubiquinone biosynthesis protein Coq4